MQTKIIIVKPVVLFANKARNPTNVEKVKMRVNVPIPQKIMELYKIKSPQRNNINVNIGIMYFVIVLFLLS